jgi:hypothetical protein
MATARPIPAMRPFMAWLGGVRLALAVCLWHISHDFVKNPAIGATAPVSETHAPSRGATPTPPSDHLSGRSGSPCEIP